MSHLETLLMNEVRKPLEQMQNKNIGYIDGESSMKFITKLTIGHFASKLTRLIMRVSRTVINLVQLPLKSALQYT